MATLEVFPAGPNGETLCTIVCPPLPAEGASPRLRVFVIDVSGSMSAPALVQVAGGAREETGRTILDVVCDAAIAAIATLGPCDGAAIVSFSDAARVCLPETTMSAEGRERARAVLRSLRPGGSTHLWDGLEKGMDLVRGALESGSAMARCASVDILTDGLPNVDPPNMLGFVASLRDYFAQHAFRPLVNCLGFGSNIQQEVLDELAREGGGHFSFIPSPDMVATNFVNSAAAFGAAFTATPTLLHGVVPGAAGGTPLPGLSLGLLPYGARVSFLVTLPPGVARDSLALRVGGGGGGGTAMAAERNPDEATAGEAAVAQWRSRLCATLRECKRLGQLGDLAGALALVRGLSEGMRAVDRGALGAPAAAALGCLLGDVEGQVAISLSRAEYFAQWGSAYLLSLARAHELQLCANFKDPGLQGYATPVFKALQSTAGGVFRTALAAASAESAGRAAAAGGGGGAPSPGGRFGGGGPQGFAHAAPPPPRAAAAAALFDPAGGCVHGEGRVAVPREAGEGGGGGGEGSGAPATVRVDALRPGARVLLAHPAGATGTVTHIVRTRVEPGVACVALRGGLVATAWHPVRLGGQWVFPARAPAEHVASAGVAAMYPSARYVYSVAVRCEGAGAAYGIFVDGVPVITLGHGVAGDAVLSHAFYGTRAVLDALEGVEAWRSARGIAAADFALGEGAWAWHNNEATGEVRIVYCGPAEAAPGAWGGAQPCAGSSASASAGAGAPALARAH
jgi:hypothetical protein